MEDQQEFKKVEFTPEVAKSSESVKDTHMETKPQKAGKKKAPLFIVLAVVVIGAGIGSGYALSQLMPIKGMGSSDAAGTITAGTQGVKVGDVYGSKDEDTFSDKAEGVLVKGGIDGEGSHHLLRPGGKSQNVYVTSSVVDMDQFVGAKIKVAGETFASQKAGWLMDVGRVQVEELNAQKPFEEEE